MFYHFYRCTYWKSPLIILYYLPVRHVAGIPCVAGVAGGWFYHGQPAWAWDPERAIFARNGWRSVDVLDCSLIWLRIRWGYLCLIFYGWQSKKTDPYDWYDAQNWVSPFQKPQVSTLKCSNFGWFGSIPTLSYPPYAVYIYNICNLFCVVLMLTRSFLCLLCKSPGTRSSKWNCVFLMRGNQCRLVSFVLKGIYHIDHTTTHTVYLYLRKYPNNPG